MRLGFHEFRRAGRRLARTPSFTATVVVVLAAGIAANTALFSVASALLLRPLPYPAAERLVLLWSTGETKGEHLPVSYPDFLDWQAAIRPRADLAAYAGTSATLTAAGAARHLDGELVSTGYFALLGIPTEIGRAFTPADEHSPVALISHALWRQELGGDPRIVGRKLVLNGVPVTVIGVMPLRFRAASGPSDFWLPIQMLDRLKPHLGPLHFLASRDVRWHQVIGRLHPGAAPEHARTELAAVGANLAHLYPVTNAKRGIDLAPARDEWVGDLRPQVLLLSGAVLLVLLLACTNIANLLLIRAAGYRHQIALRQALGAERRDLVRELLAESLVLAATGGLLGLMGAALLSPLLVRFALPELPAFAAPGLDWRVLGFVAVACLVTGLVFGLPPALKSSRLDLGSVLREAGRTGTGGPAHRRWLRGFVIAEVALATVLLVGSGLLLRSFERARAVDLGFELRSRQSLQLEIVSGDPRRWLVLYQRILERVGGLPGVRSAALASNLQLTSQWTNGPVAAEGQAPAPHGEEVRADQYDVTPGFFSTMGIPLLKGRDFEPGDGPSARRVAVVSRSLAARFWPGQPPLGQRLRLDLKSDSPWLTVVAVVGDTRHNSPLSGPGDPDLYLPLAQDPTGRLALVVHTGDRSGLNFETIRQALGRIDPGISAYGGSTMGERFAAQTVRESSSAYLITGFALGALLLAALGIHGVTAYSVRLRRRELGIRMALGADAEDILGLLFRETLQVAVAGLAIGLLAAYLAARVLASRFYEVTAHDPATYLGVPVVMALLALASTSLPAYRATRIDPATPLKSE